LPDGLDVPRAGDESTGTAGCEGMGMGDEFRVAKGLVGETVRMRFDDGHEVAAVLFSATTDLDGTEHLIYGDVVWSSEAGSYNGSANTCYYGDGKALVRVGRLE